MNFRPLSVSLLGSLFPGRLGALGMVKRIGMAGNLCRGRRGEAKLGLGVAVLLAVLALASAAQALVLEINTGPPIEVEGSFTTAFKGSSMGTYNAGDTLGVELPTPTTIELINVELTAILPDVPGTIIVPGLNFRDLDPPLLDPPTVLNGTREDLGDGTFRVRFDDVDIDYETTDEILSGTLTFNFLTSDGSLPMQVDPADGVLKHPALLIQQDDGSACGSFSAGTPRFGQDWDPSTGEIGLRGFACYGGGTLAFEWTLRGEIAEFADFDNDGVPDAEDNCSEVANEDQLDTNLDGFGNICDADLNNDDITSNLDLGLFKGLFFSTDADADFNGDGVVSNLDLGIFKSLFFQPPGPSGLSCAGTIPCPLGPEATEAQAEACIQLDLDVCSSPVCPCFDALDLASNPSWNICSAEDPCTFVNALPGCRFAEIEASEGTHTGIASARVNTLTGTECFIEVQDLGLNVSLATTEAESDACIALIEAHAQGIAGQLDIDQCF